MDEAAQRTEMPCQSLSSSVKSGFRKETQRLSVSHVCANVVSQDSCVNWISEWRGRPLRVRHVRNLGLDSNHSRLETSPDTEQHMRN